VLKKTGFCEDVNLNEQVEVRERVEAILQKLQVLKSMISELRARFEELQTSGFQGHSSAFRCDECGDAIEEGQEVEARNFSEKTHHYHKECFRKIWLQ
jgi:hypothetical protein